MTKRLVLIHGREQQNMDPSELKRDWITALKDGLQKTGLTLPISDDDIHFPYYGDTLDQLVQGVPPEDAANVVIRGEGSNDQAAMFVRTVLLQTQQRFGISNDQVLEQVAPADRAVIERGILNWGWVQKVLETLDQHVPYASSTSVALATRDVYRYLHKPGIRALINQAVAQAMKPGVETVVVGHSLGSVVAYNLLKEDGAANNWKVPLFVTIGSPLAVRAIKESVRPRKHPSCADKWFNAMDPRDVVSLYPLDEEHFSVDPAIENKTDVDNPTENRHGISGYLGDPQVAKRIHNALTS